MAWPVGLAHRTWSEEENHMMDTGGSSVRIPDVKQDSLKPWDPNSQEQRALLKCKWPI